MLFMRRQHGKSIKTMLFVLSSLASTSSPLFPIYIPSGRLAGTPQSSSSVFLLKLVAPSRALRSQVLLGIGAVTGSQPHDSDARRRGGSWQQRTHADGGSVRVHLWQSFVRDSARPYLSADGGRSVTSGFPAFERF